VLSELFLRVFCVFRALAAACKNLPLSYCHANATTAVALPRRSQREFTCSDFASRGEKNNRQMKTMFEGELSPSHEQLKGYQETFLDFIQHGMEVQRSAKMLVGPCNINLQKIQNQ
jgi:hypothetical protein